METEGAEGDIIYSVPWVRDTLEGAGALISSGVNVEVVIFMVICVPILMRALQLAGMYVRTHNMDLRETIRIEGTRARLELRREFGALYDEEIVRDSAMKLELEADDDK
jgi:GH15 family glucan-1,4-alpha-glucosidase